MAAPLAPSEKHWLPVESNPAVLTAYARKLGLPADCAFHDVLSDEEWALAMVPPPVHAVFMLFPIKDSSEAHRADEAARIARDGQAPAPPSLWFARQNIDNACGTLAVLHAVANSCTLTGGPLALPPGCWFERFIVRTGGADPAERAAALDGDDEVDAEQEATAQQGQSAVVDDTSSHFLALVHKGGRLWELDGRKEVPVDHGPCTPDSLLADAARVVRGFMDRDAGELRYTMLALGGRGEEEEEEDEGAGAGEGAAAPADGGARADAPAL